MTKEEMIEYLEEDDFQYIMTRDGGVEMLRSILSYGFMGYTNYTQADLEAEMNERDPLNGRD